MSFIVIFASAMGCGDSVDCTSEFLPAIALSITDSEAQNVSEDNINLKRDGRTFECKNFLELGRYFCNPQEDGDYLLVIEFGEDPENLNQRYEQRFTIGYEEVCNKPVPAYDEVIQLGL